jgi:hypothetical protein
VYGWLDGRAMVGHTVVFSVGVEKSFIFGGYFFLSYFQKRLSLFVMINL